LTLAASNLNDGAAVVPFKLMLADRNGLYAAIGASGNVPEKIHVRPFAFAVKPW